MKRRSMIGMCLLLGLSLSTFELAQRAIAAEPLPDASVVAYRGSRQPKQPQPTVSDVTLTGVIDGLQPNGLTIKASKDNKSKDRKEWFVTSGTASEFTIRGTAAAEYVRKGQLVEFSSQIVEGEKTADKPKEDKVADKVSDFTIVSRKRGSSLAKKGGAKDHAADAGVSAIGPQVQSRRQIRK